MFKLKNAAIVLLSLLIATGGATGSHVASASPDGGTKVTKGQSCKKVGAQRNGFHCKEVKGKKVWWTRSRSTSATVYPEWGSVTLEPFTVPVSGCKEVEIKVFLDEPSKMQQLGMEVFIMAGPSGPYVYGELFPKSFFEWYGTRTWLKVCAEDWMQDYMTRRVGIKPNKTYLFMVRTYGALGGPPPYNSETWFSTGQ